MAAFCYGSYQLSTKKLTSFLPPLTVLLFSVFGVMLFLAAYHTVSGVSLLPVSSGTYLYLALLALVSQVFGQGLVVYSLSQLRAGVVAVGLLMQPVFTAIIGYIVLGQALTFAQILCGLMVLTGIMITVVFGRSSV